MSIHRIVMLRFEAEPDWARASAGLDALVPSAPIEEVQLVRTRAERATLVVVASDHEALAAFTREVFEPWLGAHALTLDAPVVDGELILQHGPLAPSDPRDDEARIHAFVEAVRATGKVWGLRGKTWARSPAAGDVEALPLWPDETAALRCAVGAWQGFTARSIELAAFLDEWLVGMQEDGIVAVVMPTPTHPGTIVAPDVLASRLG